MGAEARAEAASLDEVRKRVEAEVRAAVRAEAKAEAEKEAKAALAAERARALQAEPAPVRCLPPLSAAYRPCPLGAAGGAGKARGQGGGGEGGGGEGGAA